MPRGLHNDGDKEKTTFSSPFGYRVLVMGPRHPLPNPFGTTEPCPGPSYPLSLPCAVRGERTPVIAFASKCGGRVTPLVEIKATFAVLVLR